MGVLASAVGHAPASLVFGAQASNARGAAKAHPHAFQLAPKALARQQVYAMRGPLSCEHSLRKVRCGALPLLASSGAAKFNRSIYTDTQVHRAAGRRLFMGAGNFQR
jgi:hypothetical protein